MRTANLMKIDMDIANEGFMDRLRPATLMIMRRERDAACGNRLPANPRIRKQRVYLRVFHESNIGCVFGCADTYALVDRIQ